MERKAIVNKQFIKWTAISAIIMCVLPLLIVMFASDTGMALCFVLFFTVNPIYSLVLGYETGKDVNSLWLLPLISAAMFITGVWLLFTMSEPLFIMYALVYLGLSAAAMMVSWYLLKYNRRNQHD